MTHTDPVRRPTTDTDLIDLVRPVSPHREYARNARVTTHDVSMDQQLDEAAALTARLSPADFSGDTATAVRFLKSGAAQPHIRARFTFERVSFEGEAVVRAYHLTVAMPGYPHFQLLIADDGQRALAQLVSLEAMVVPNFAAREFDFSSVRKLLLGRLRFAAILERPEANFWQTFGLFMQQYGEAPEVSRSREASAPSLLQAYVRLFGAGEIADLATPLVYGLSDGRSAGPAQGLPFDRLADPQERALFVERARAAADYTGEQHVFDVVGAPCFGGHEVVAAEYLGRFYEQAVSPTLRGVRCELRHTWLVQLGADEGGRWTMAQLSPLAQLRAVPAVRASPLDPESHLVLLAREIAAGTVKPVRPSVGLPA